MTVHAKALAVIFLVALDQASKWATDAFLPWQQDVGFLPFVALFRTYNTGVAFSMLSEAGPWPLIALTVVVTALMLWLWRRTPPDRRFAQAGFALIVAGALGNLIDRVWHGYVIDMIRVHTETWSFAVFNVADSYISVGAAFIIIDEVLAMRDQRRSKHKDANP